MIDWESTTCVVIDGECLELPVGFSVRPEDERVVIGKDFGDGQTRGHAIRCDDPNARHTLKAVIEWFEIAEEKYKHRAGLMPPGIYPLRDQLIRNGEVIPPWDAAGESAAAAMRAEVQRWQRERMQTQGNPWLTSVIPVG